MFHLSALVLAGLLCVSGVQAQSDSSDSVDPVKLAVVGGVVRTLFLRRSIVGCGSTIVD
jgi:hypothetical protein